MIVLNNFQGKQEKPNKKYLWKFLDFYKFLYFIENKSLYFSRLDQFDDVLEGASKEYAFHKLNSYLKLIRMDKSNEKKEYTDSNKRKLNEIVKYLNQIQKDYFANCFYNLDGESSAMWKIYSGSFGVAIRFETVSLFNLIEDFYNNSMSNSYKFSYGTMDYQDILAPDYKTIFELNTDKNEFNPFRKDNAYRFEEE